MAFTAYFSSLNFLFSESIMVSSRPLPEDMLTAAALVLTPGMESPVEYMPTASRPSASLTRLST